MSQERFRLTANGGVALASGNIYTIAMHILAQRKPGQPLFVRHVDKTWVVAEIRNDSVVVTEHGAQVDLPPWAVQLSHLIKGES